MHQRFQYPGITDGGLAVMLLGQGRRIIAG
jgi:hypothetical protein